MHWPKNFLRITLSSGTKRLVQIQRIVDHIKKNTDMTDQQIFDDFAKDHNIIIEWTQHMNWNDAFPCRCMGGVILDWDNEWKQSFKELI